MTNQHPKRHSTSLAIGGVRVHTAGSYHSTLTRIATQNVLTVSRAKEPAEQLKPCRWECTMVRPLWKTVWRVLEKSIVSLPFDATVPLLGARPMESPEHSGPCKGTCVHGHRGVNAHGSGVCDGPKLETSKCPSMGEWVNKLVYPYHGPLLSNKRNKSFLGVTELFSILFVVGLAQIHAHDKIPITGPKRKPIKMQLKKGRLGGAVG